jgi:lysophospholipase L1-like esterase
MKMAAVTLAVIFVLFLAEGVLRLLGQPAAWDPGRDVLGNRGWSQGIHRASSIPGLDYELRPNVDAATFGWHIITNDLGMRSPAVTLAKPAGVRRIQVLGDSTSFGWGVDQQQTYASVLQRLLDRTAAGRYQVLNLAVSGYNTQDEVNLFLQRGAPMGPDLIVLGYSLNDPEQDPLQPLKAFYQPARLWRRSHLLRLARLAEWKYRVWRIGGNDYDRYLHRDPRSWSSVTTAMARLAIWTRAHEVPVIVMIFPDLKNERWPEYPAQDLHAQVAAAARAQGFLVLDLLPVYRDYPRSDLMVTPEDPHPSPFAHELTARALDSFIAANVPSLLAPGP